MIKVCWPGRAALSQRSLTDTDTLPAQILAACLATIGRQDETDGVLALVCLLCEMFYNAIVIQMLEKDRKTDVSRLPGQPIITFPRTRYKIHSNVDVTEQRLLAGQDGSLHSSSSVQAPPPLIAFWGLFDFFK